MKVIWLYVALFFSVSASADFSEEDRKYTPELRSAAWSSDLTKQDISDMRFAIYRMVNFNNTYARKVLAPYIGDSRNVEARYIYALALAEANIDSAIEMLKQLSIEGYPSALITYREERVCKLEQYKEICNEFGFNEVMKRAYLEWVRKDPLDLSMYLRAVYHMPNYGKKENGIDYQEESLALLKEGMDKGCSECAQALYRYYFDKVKSADDIQALAIAEPYKVKTKEMMLTGQGGAIPNRHCHKEMIGFCTDIHGYTKDVCLRMHEEEKKYGVCLTQDGNKTLLAELAKKGDIAQYRNLFFNLNYDKPAYNSQKDLYYYLRFGDESNQISPSIKAQYDHAIKLNNGRGWGYHGYVDSIENWEKLYQDKETKSFFEKLGGLLGSD